MHFKIHRGTKEIGGSCVEVWTDATRVILDLGMPLVNPDGSQFDASEYQEADISTLIAKGLLPDIEGIYSDECDTHLLLSHAHLDHYGLMHFVSPNSIFHLGEATHKLISIHQKYVGQKQYICNCEYFKHKRPFMIGDIKITPYLMDHSAFDAYAFRIESGGKSIFYTGDFRSHGRKSLTFRHFCDSYTHDTDYLIMEGTTLGRTNQPIFSEVNLEKQFIDVFAKSNGISLVYTASQNIDRIVTIYKACSKAGRTLIMDNYTAAVMRAINTNGTLPVPSSSFKNIKVYFSAKVNDNMPLKDQRLFLFEAKSYKISKDDINSNPRKYVMLVRPSMTKHLETLNLDGGEFVYSLWSGYKKTKQTSQFLQYLKNRGVGIHTVHTSGHADNQALKLMVSAIAPKYIVPIHTLSANVYESTFPAHTVKLVNDGEDVGV